MVKWILHNNYRVDKLVHYFIDDFISMGPPGSTICHQDLATALTVFRQLGLPLHPMVGSLRLGVKWCTVLAISWNVSSPRLPGDLRAIGYGAFWGNEWLNGYWFPQQRDFCIAYKESFPVALAGEVWGPQWSRRHVQFLSDNEAVVAILNSRTSKVPGIMHLVWYLLMSAAKYNLFFTAYHIPGVHNVVSDGLSRFHWQEF